jgi:DNA modification methylase
MSVIVNSTTAIACIKEKRHFIGFEKNEEYFLKAKKRIELELSQPTLF